MEEGTESDASYSKVVAGGQVFNRRTTPNAIHTKHTHAWCAVRLMQTKNRRHNDAKRTLMHETRIDSIVVALWASPVTKKNETALNTVRIGEMARPC